MQEPFFSNLLEFGRNDAEHMLPSDHFLATPSIDLREIRALLDAFSESFDEVSLGERNISL